jgi:hypothetical protein
MLTSKLNNFFGKISYKNYEFKNTTETKKNEEDRKQKVLRKAYRIFKKKKLYELPKGMN